MNRDEKLIQAILEMVKAEPSGRGIAFGIAQAAKLQRSPAEIDEHLKLAEEDGLIEVASKPINGPIIVRRLTSRGHDYLAPARRVALPTPFDGDSWRLKEIGALPPVVSSNIKGAEPQLKQNIEPREGEHHTWLRRFKKTFHESLRDNLAKAAGATMAIFIVTLFGLVARYFGVF